MSRYDFTSVEAKWQKYWEEHETFKTDVWDFSKPKFYALDMFPYPSGVGLHAGHPEGYTATDIVSRMKRMQGYNVLHPMGYDSFGLPAEQYAVNTGNHPNGFTQENIKTFSKQLKELGFDYDWSKMVATSDPEFYKWTQWIFKQLYLDGYAKYIDMPVNWCEELGTVLSNDEVIDGKSERGGFPVVRKNMKQWVIDQPAFAEKLLEGLDEIDWPESTKAMQRNWIGKSTGVEVEFDIVGGGKFSIFTTCIETIYGITFMVLAPDGAITESLLDRVQNREEVEAYIAETKKKNDMDRTELNKTKSGCELKGVTCINPVNGKEVRMFIGDFVLASYGTGAVMAVPSHDQRDFEYAIAHNIDMIQVIDGKDGHIDVSEAAMEKTEYLGKGYKLINSEEFTGLTVEEAKEAITQKLEKMGRAKRTVNYHFREWIFARQRYWGEPVPVVHGEDGQIHVLEDEELPLVLPELDDYKGKNGKAPLENATEWKKYDKNGIKGTRETSTMPGSAGSSWYYFRYIDPHNDKEFANQELLKHWMPVDLYIGGPEHAVGHLMYSRIWNRYLYDKGLAPTKEPFKKLVHQGMILGENGIKMGKRFPEFVVNPSDIVRDYGADTLRLYEMFMGPLEVSKPWSKSGVEGAKRFVQRVWNFFTEAENLTDDNDGALTKVYHQTVKKVTDDFEKLAFNTAISQMMIFVNAVYKNGKCPREYAEGLIKMLSCITPHMGEEIWSIMGHNDTIAYESWPVYDEELCKEDTIEIVVQVNGKLKAKLNIEVDADKDSVMEMAMSDEKVKEAVDGKNILKQIYVPNKLVNIVAK
ncbi:MULTISPECIES: leucine--tRNA ligase [Ruminococcus]|uniref:Leucine--tRNA ligase n=1 Tax=Ruminococcus flavefaciens TaxID=1265 RepID=A0A1M7MCY1_RUMFL|nr:MULTISPECIES: leucine--tRNA ligase [Ruminococcus]MCR4794625.1 leucine--tRNA ligase [Ruminococcus sp.]SHM88647.1 leucyl-tRNA synthetase [Ruminococcus flavefaciens]